MRIGLLIQDLKSEYSKLIIKGTQKYCLENGIQLFVFITRAKNWNNDVYEYQHIACKELASAENVDGIILVTSTYCQNIPEEEHQSLVDELNYLPLVSFGAKIPGYSSVTGNGKKSFDQLLNHLEQEHGCKNMFLMGPKSTSKDMSLRFQSFRKFIQTKNQNPEERIIYAPHTYESAKKALQNLKVSKNNLPFDTIVCCNDELAFGCIDYLKERNIKVPDEVIVTGFDNQVRCGYSKPGLTSIDMCLEEQSYEAARILHSQINDPSKEKENLVLDSKVIYRPSCGCHKECKNLISADGKYLMLRDQMYQYQYFLQDLQATVDPEKIKQLLIKNFQNFGIGSCVCCIYDHSITMKQNEEIILPDKAQVYFAYNKDKVYKYDSNFLLNPKKNMYPEDFIFEEGKEIIVTVLYDHEYQFGYLIYTPSELNYNIYEMIATTTCISLATNIVFYEKVRETERLASEKLSLESETYFDGMTGALNRRGLYKYALPAMGSALERGLTGGVIFGDMDYLKKINDTYGHEAGDRAIKGVVEILKKALRPQDVIARLGGDEFVVVACGLAPDAYETVKARIEATLKEYNMTHGEPFEISLSLGYVEFTRENRNLDILMKKADEIQYKEKVLHHRNRM